MRSASAQITLACPKCGSRQVNKGFSIFGVGGGESRPGAAACAPIT